MQKPDFKELNRLIKAIEDTCAGFDSMFADRQLQLDKIRAICSLIAADYAKEALSEISVEELKNAKQGIRVSVLQEAGFNNLGDIAKATDYDIQSIEGIGEKQTEAIRHIITEFANSLSSRYAVKLSVPESGQMSEKDTDLVTELYRFIRCENIRLDAKEPFEGLKKHLDTIRNDKMIRNGVRWFFSGSALKMHTLEMADHIYSLTSSDFFNKLLGLIDRYSKALSVSGSEAVAAFMSNSADFYALLENLDSGTGHKPFVYDSIPAQLAEDIDSTPLDISSFSGNLRAYQTFGAKYIVHQKKVLLGDEMGLGKTVQAIAAMTHIDTSSQGICHFLVICPASVLINWDREIKKFSRIKTFILHGQTIEDSFEKWKESGGAAITNYESMGKIVDDIDDHMSISLLVVDEAHYMKNPDAQRTRYIRRLDNESDRIVMMTGTPLENKVDEMCNLIEFIRPDMVKEVRGMALISNLPEFREKLAPMYLRRTRKQVLTELPPIAEEQEWCDMTELDKASYAEAVLSRNFAEMRRISFLQNDLSKSSKAQRLMELCNEAGDEGRKVVVFSYFRETIAKVSNMLGDRCAGVISGDTKIEFRQPIIDKFSSDEGRDVLVCQIQAGGVGLNIQAASIVIFCEPQIKPSLTWQALSRVYRMGQVRNVLVYHLLCAGGVDDAMINILQEKEVEFANFADKSVVADAYDNIIDKDWIKKVIEQEHQKYLPMVI